MDFFTFQQSAQSTLNDLLAWVNRSEEVLKTKSLETLNQRSLSSTLQQVEVIKSLLVQCGYIVTQTCDENAQNHLPVIEAIDRSSYRFTGVITHTGCRENLRKVCESGS